MDIFHSSGTAKPTYLLSLSFEVRGCDMVLRRSCFNQSILKINKGMYPSRRLSLSCQCLDRLISPVFSIPLSLNSGLALVVDLDDSVSFDVGIGLLSVSLVKSKYGVLFGAGFTAAVAVVPGTGSVLGEHPRVPVSPLVATKSKLLTTDRPFPTNQE